MRFRIFLAGIFLAASHCAGAAEIPHEVEPTESGNGDHLELGLSIAYGVFPLIGLNNVDSLAESGDRNLSIDLVIEGRLQYRGVFLELIRGSFESLALGYSVYENEHRSFELIAAKLFGKVERDHVERLELIEDREGDVNLGFRRSRFFGSTVLQTELVSNLSSSHLGFIGTVKLGHQKQIRNWTLHGLLGVRYLSSDVVDQYFGVSRNEMGGQFNEHRGSDGIISTVQVGISYPLSEKFVFNASVVYDQFPNAISDSPLAQGDSRLDTRVGISYIIGDG